MPAPQASEAGSIPTSVNQLSSAEPWHGGPFQIFNTVGSIPSESTDTEGSRTRIVGLRANAVLPHRRSGFESLAFRLCRTICSVSQNDNSCIDV